MTMECDVCGVSIKYKYNTTEQYDSFFTLFSINLQTLFSTFGFDILLVFLFIIRHIEMLNYYYNGKKNTVIIIFGERRKDEIEKKEIDGEKRVIDSWLCRARTDLLERNTASYCRFILVV